MEGRSNSSFQRASSVPELLTPPSPRLLVKPFVAVPPVGQQQQLIAPYESQQQQNEEKSSSHGTPLQGYASYPSRRNLSRPVPPLPSNPPPLPPLPPRRTDSAELSPPPLPPTSQLPSTPIPTIPVPNQTPEIATTNSTSSNNHPQVQTPRSSSEETINHILHFFQFPRVMLRSEGHCYFFLLFLRLLCLLTIPPLVSFLL